MIKPIEVPSAPPTLPISQDAKSIQNQLPVTSLTATPSQKTPSDALRSAEPVVTKVEPVIAKPVLEEEEKQPKIETANPK